MGFSKIWTCTALLSVLAKAQLATYSSDGAAISVNIPSDTSAGSSQTIYFQISARSGTQWVGFGQGDSMTGANMFVVYSASDSNVTVSPRSGTGHSLPNFNSAAQISVLDGTGITSDGSYVANVRCDNCLSWSGGTMDPKSTSANWIWAIKNGDPLNDPSTSASFTIHDSMGQFTLDLASATGGSSSNPFISSTASSGGASSSSSSGVSSPSATSGGMNSGSSSRGSSSSNNTSQVRVAHAILMSLVFVVLFPVAALTLYLPYAEKVRYIHGPLQLLALILSIIGVALGAVLGRKVDQLDAYHQIIGYLVVGILLLFQPALGILQHLHYRKTGGKSPMGIVHRWLGRAMIILGVINGGLGFMQSGPVSSQNVPSYSVVAYSIAAGVVFFLYLSILFATTFSAKHPKQSRTGEKLSPSQSYFPRYPERSNTQTYTTSNRYHGYGYDQRL